ncbi:MAG: DUF5320 domain-containing protein [bacterium]
MPRGDGTGPTGMGPMTGRAAGFCAGFSVPGSASSSRRRGFRNGTSQGFQGRGFRSPGRPRVQGQTQPQPSGRGAGGCGWRYGFCVTGLPGWARFGR